MLRGMALSQTDLDRLDTAIATAELEVEVDGQRTRYRSMVELQSARQHIAQVLAAGSVAAPRPTGAFRYQFTTSRGD